MTQPRRAPGFFVTFEGPEGAGKSTQASRLADALRASGRRVTLTREPGGTHLGERVREVLLDASGAAHDPLADALLFNAARAQLLTEVIRPALERDDTVICDRFADSTLAYQGCGMGVPPGTLSDLAHAVTEGLRPDVTFLLDLPAEVGLARKSGAETRFEQAYDLAFHERVRAGFLAIAAGEPDRVVVIDATREPDMVTVDVLDALHRRTAGMDPATTAPIRSEPDPASLRIIP